MVPRTLEDRILLVDDLALVRRTIPARLGVLGSKFSTVSNVPEAREWLEKQTPVLFLLDVVLPGVDGLTFCRELKADARFQEIPVIMLTDVGGNIFERSLEAGADDCLPKRSNDAFLRIRVQLHMHLVELRHKHAGLPAIPSAGQVVLATHSTLLQAQLPSQLAMDGHQVRVADRLDEIIPSLTGEESLLVLDMAVDPEGIHDFLSQLRMNPETAAIPVLLLCDKDEVEGLTGLEFMLDDVLVKPLTAPVSRHRLRLLLEMSRLLRGL